MVEPITFDHSIYSPDSITAAADAYAELLTVSLSAEEGCTTAHFEGVDAEDGPYLVDAFCNHVLFDTIQRYRTEGATA
jgi:hypothetical protein